EPLPVVIVSLIEVELSTRQPLVRFEVDALSLTHRIADEVRTHRGDLIEVLLEPLREEDVVSLAPPKQQNWLAFVLPIPGILCVDLNAIRLIGDKNGCRSQERDPRSHRAEKRLIGSHVELSVFGLQIAGNTV
ncbi:MAG: hypothetical protein QGG09_18570, partial [Pirellulaceae bacterium]|nr:hypothetical protein [Pirellulaceae bacterium]